MQLYQVETDDGIGASQVETEDGVETIVVEVLEETRVVNGVTCVVVRDQEFLDELLIEDTHDWYAQDDDGNVWYMGESVINYEYDDDDNIISTDNEGSWEAGVDGAIPGIIMKATLIIGDSYQQEFYEGEAEDMAKIEALEVQVELEDGTIYNNCLQTLEWDPLEPDDEEYKYYAPDVGLIKEELVDGDETAEQKGIFLTGIDRVPDFEAAGFTNPTTIDNTYLPLIPGTTLTYEAETVSSYVLLPPPCFPTYIRCCFKWRHVDAPQVSGQVDRHDRSRRYRRSDLRAIRIESQG